MPNARLNDSQAGIKIARRNINNFRYADDTTLMAESEEELKSLLMKVKEESEKAGLKLNIQKRIRLAMPGMQDRSLVKDPTCHRAAKPARSDDCSPHTLEHA